MQEETKYEKISHTEDVKFIGAKVQTSLGEFELELFADKAPLAVWNFVNLAEGRQENVKNGPFYEGILFHRVIDGFMIQAGCPLGNGTGGPGYEFENEHSDLKHDGPGVLAMANRGPDTNGSQFYITLAAHPSLDEGYTVFGKITSGLDTIKKIGKVKVAPQDNRPYEDVVIQKIEIIRD